MVVEEGLSTVVFEPINTKQSKSTWDPMNCSSSSSGVKRSKQCSSSSSYSTGSSSSESSSDSGNSSKKQQKEAPASDPWGSILKNREHFIDMHLC